MAIGFGAGCGAGSADDASDSSSGSDAPAGSSATRVVHVDSDGAEAVIAKPQAVIVDVRTPREFSSGHIRGATNIDFYGSDFEQRLAELDRENTYLVHCAVGGRSTSALATFQKLGFESVVHLDGGYKAWKRSGKPVAD